MRHIRSLTTIVALLLCGISRATANSILDRTITMPVGRSTWEQTITKIASKGGLSLMAVSAPHAPVVIEDKEGSVRSYLDAVAQQTGTDWLLAGNFLIWPAQSSVSAPSLPASRGKRDQELQMGPLLIHRGQMAPRYLGKFINSLPLSTVADMVDGVEIDQPTLNPQQRYLVEALDALLGADAPSQETNEPIRVALTPLLTPVADQYQALTGGVSSLLEQSVLIRSTATRLPDSQAVLRAGDLSALLSKQMRLPVLCEEKLQGIKLVTAFRQRNAREVMEVLPLATDASITSKGMSVSIRAAQDSEASTSLARPGVSSVVLPENLNSVVAIPSLESFSHQFPAFVLHLRRGGREARLLFYVRDTPSSNTGAYNCGLLSLFALSNLRGRDVSLEKKVAVGRQWPNSTVSMADLVQAARYLDLDLKGVAASPEELSQLAPCILSVDPNHFLLLQTVGNGIVQVVDNGVPSTMKTNELVGRYKGFALVSR